MRPSILSLVLFVTASVGLSQVRPTAEQNTISSQEARRINRRVAQMSPALRVAPNRVARVPGTAPPQPAPERVAPTAGTPVRPKIAELQLVRPDAVTEAHLNRALVAQVQLRQAVAQGGQVLPLPGIVRQLDQTGGVAQLKAFVLAGRRLAYDSARDMFVGSIRVGVSDIVPGPPRDLVTPITFYVIDAEEAEPSEIRVERTNGLKEIAVRLAAAPGGATIRIASDLSPEGMPITLPLIPRLSADPGNTSVEGWGLGATDINISVVGLDRPAGRMVTLRTTSGYLTPSRVKLDDFGMASTTIRSDRLGPARITASSPGLQVAAAEVDFRLPYLTAISSLLGALLGALVRLFGGRRRGSFIRSLIAAAGAGILIFALYAIGVNVLPVTPSVTVGLVLVFAVSGLGAYLGSKLLEKKPS